MAKKASKAAATEEDDDLLAGKATAKASKKPAKTAAKANGKAKPKKASAEEVDEILETKKKKPAAKANGKAKPKREVTRAEDIADTDDVRSALLKCKKPTSYIKVHETTGFNLRQIRRTARALRDAGEVELTKQGTEVFVQRAA